MPAQDGVGREQRTDFAPELAPQDLALHGQAATLIVVELDPFLAELLAEHLDYRSLILDYFLLVVVDPPGKNGQQKLPRLENETHVAPEWRFRRPLRCWITLEIGRKGAGSTHLKCHSIQQLHFG
jgi:hypothetical protein